MSELLKIYENVIRHGEEATRIEKCVTEEVIRLSKPYEGKLSCEELEKLQDIMFSVALTAEHEGFRLGARYFAKMLIIMDMQTSCIIRCERSAVSF